MAEVLEVDARGLLCPLPLLRLKSALRALESGAEVLLRATDPHLELDLEAFLARSGHQLLSSERREGEQRFRLRLR